MELSKFFFGMMMDMLLLYSVFYLRNAD